MKVLQINSVCGTGSTGRIATDIHNELIKNGIESYIAYGRGEPLNCNNAIRIGTDWDVKIHGLKSRIFDNQGFNSKKATINFIKKLKEINPDIIHLHNIHGYYLNIEILFNYLKTANKKIIWTLHDCWTFTGHCAHFDFIKYNKWKTQCENCPKKTGYPASYILDNSKANFLKKKEIFTGIKDLTIITPSKWLADLVKKSFLKEYSVEVINNGIDTETFKYTESNFRERYNLKDKFIILGVASPWSKRKGFDEFIKLEKLLDNDQRIVLVGLNDNQLKNLPSKIIGIKRTNSTKELAEIYSASNIFFNPTYEDNYPTTNLEALSCGLSIITYNTGGSIECVQKNSGWIIEKGNFSKVIEIINKNKELLIRKNKIDVSNQFDKREFVKKQIKELDLCKFF